MTRTEFDCAIWIDLAIDITKKALDLCRSIVATVKAMVPS
jgi:hypothetical protein